MSGTLGAAGYDAWFDTRWGRHGCHVERQALLTAAGPLTGCRWPTTASTCPWR